MDQLPPWLRNVLFPMLAPSDLKGLDALSWYRRRWLRLGFPAFVAVVAADWFLLPHERWVSYYLVAVWVFGVFSLRVVTHYAVQAAARDKNRPDIGL